MKKIKVEISDSVKEVLSAGRVEDCFYFLPTIQLSREKYVEVNKILELLGGKWNRGKKAHVFESPEKAQSIFSSVETGEVIDKKKTYQFFETPKELAQQMVELADIHELKKKPYYLDVLEPSAGHGAIADEINASICSFRCTEIDPEKAQVLMDKGHAVFIGDFLTQKDEEFDRIIMNPPFTRGQDAEHVLHAYSLLRKGGKVVSVMSASVKFNQQKKYQKVRDLVEKNGEIQEIDAGTFKESGTLVNTVLVILNK